MFLRSKFVYVYTTFYGASTGAVRFGGTFRISDFRGREIS